MSLIGRVGRKRPRARLAMALVYLALILGATTAVYPFLFMASTGFKGPTDQNDNKVVPSFWSDNQELVNKYRDDKYAGDADLMASYNVGGEANPQEINEYRQFLDGLSIDRWKAGFRVPPQGVTSKLAVRWQKFLRHKYHGDINALNKAYIDLNQAFQQVPIPVEAWERASWSPPQGQKWKDWIEFKSSLPAEFRIPIRTEWMWQEFLRAKYKNRIENVPGPVRQGAKLFANIEWNSTLEQLASHTAPGSEPSQEALAAIVREFASMLPKQFSASVEALWSKSLSSKLPIAAEEEDFVQAHSADIKREFTWRNYNYVLDYIALNGRALWNTALFCLLAIGVQLIVNPLAAYALSRYPMRATARILLFLLATMAFPAEVAMIPSFLLLKNLHMLNTFAALVLPGAASGYTIYLLKGFFDSLPQEVFDSGQVDGAPEWVMMLRLALPLSKPVLGYIALMTFMGAYGAFIYAFLVCQDSSMWTLMVFVYQLQILAPKAVVMAAVTIAAVPTLVVFMACQRVIMRGIVLPGER